MVDRTGPYSEISMCSYHMRGRACSVFPTGTSVSGQENLAIRTIQPGYWEESGMNFSEQDGIVLLWYFPVINIPFNCSGTAIRVAKGMIDARLQFCASTSLLCF